MTTAMHEKHRGDARKPGSRGHWLVTTAAREPKNHRFETDLALTRFLHKNPSCLVSWVVAMDGGSGAR